MKNSLSKGIAILSISSLLAAGCQSAKLAEAEQETTSASSISANSAETQEQATESHSEESSHEHEHDHASVHSHELDEATQKIYDGFFEDSQVKDRPLSDWAGYWQSVYPYLKSGELDEVFADKASHSDKMTAEEYKEYYTTGYKTDVDRIIIKEDIVTFVQNGEELSGKYVYDGYEILTYEAGNRGVRFTFKLEEETTGLPKFIQFSDHSIFPTAASHYHLYWGNDRQALLDEVVNWPTYYPSTMDGHTIAHEMMAH
ncbi:metal-binding protein ZinT [Planococcus shenhongbingii]|uniref:metal-binding protein ZinT n=1 Tax=Planococcus shenhongbingii TaxID=3058398 RepID=UPI00263538F0|nr:metal-binding protein ZinT [Planococcus sp. N016]WKA59372.1 metal-binding protein ZinT [Planococcus sp. N016]